jgi:hypothetical protein
VACYSVAAPYGGRSPYPGFRPGSLSSRSCRALPAKPKPRRPKGATRGSADKARGIGATLSRYRHQSPSGSEVGRPTGAGRKVPRTGSPHSRETPGGLFGSVCGNPVAGPILSRHARKSDTTGGGSGGSAGTFPCGRMAPRDLDRRATPEVVGTSTPRRLTPSGRFHYCAMLSGLATLTFRPPKRMQGAPRWRASGFVCAPATTGS